MLGTAMYVALVWVCAVLLDRVFGEATRWHPLVGFGNIAKRIETRLNTGDAKLLRLRGVIAWSAAVLPWLILVWGLGHYLSSYSEFVRFVFDCGVLYWAIGWRSLCEHIRPIGSALAEGNIEQARLKISYIVSRDTTALDADQVLAAGLETTLENSSDALFASLIWFALAGPAGVVLHRLANTLDAMWGYKNHRYRYFGWWAARSDDVLNFIPAQLTALGFSVFGLSVRGFRCWFGQGWRWKSINAGSVMASGAGALNITLGGAASYHGETVLRAPLGGGAKPRAEDLERSITLINRLLMVWIVIAVIIGGLL
jgi:adenosylcobinamide-phosphate synthase